MKARRLIKSGGVAKRLMVRGHIVVDCAPQREDPTRSLFIFYNDPWLNADIDEIMQSTTSDSFTLKTRLAALGMTEAEYRQHIFEGYLESLESEHHAKKAG